MWGWLRVTGILGYDMVGFVSRVYGEDVQEKGVLGETMDAKRGGLEDQRGNHDILITRGLYSLPTLRQAPP